MMCETCTAHQSNKPIDSRAGRAEGDGRAYFAFDRPKQGNMAVAK